MNSAIAVGLTFFPMDNNMTPSLRMQNEYVKGATK